MKFQSTVTCHRSEPMYVGREPSWEERESGWIHCSYCGSVHPEGLLRALRDPRSTWEWSDFKYGFPHKLYVMAWDEKARRSRQLEGTDPDGTPRWKEGHWTHLKFYSRHLMDAGLDAEAFGEMAETIGRRTGITFVVRSGDLYWLRVQVGAASAVR